MQSVFVVVTTFSYFSANKKTIFDWLSPEQHDVVFKVLSPQARYQISAPADKQLSCVDNCSLCVKKTLFVCMFSSIQMLNSFSKNMF
jgi:hypothetical protein